MTIRYIYGRAARSIAVLALGLVGLGYTLLGQTAAGLNLPKIGRSDAPEVKVAASKPQRSRKKVNKYNRPELWQVGLDFLQQISGRFSRGDKALTNDEIAQLYYKYSLFNYDEVERYFEQRVDSLLVASTFRNAYLQLEYAIKTIPIDLKLLTRACEMAQYLGDERVEMHVWQLASLLYVIDYSGDGLTPETAYLVRSPRDAYLFETLWMGVNSEELKRPLESNSSKGLTLCYEIGKKGASKVRRYYRVYAPF